MVFGLISVIFNYSIDSVVVPCVGQVEFTLQEIGSNANLIL